VFVHLLLLLLLFVDSCVSGHCSVYYECPDIVFVYNYNVWSLVFDYMFGLDIHVPQNFRIIIMIMIIIMLKTEAGVVTRRRSWEAVVFVIIIIIIIYH